MPLKEKSLPTLPGRVYKRHSKYIDAIGCALLFLFLIIFEVKPSPGIGLYIICAIVAVPLLIAMIAKPIIREVYFDRTSIKIKYDSGIAETLPLEKCIFYLTQKDGTGLGKAYSYWLMVLYTPNLPETFVQDERVEIKKAFRVFHSLTPKRIKDFVEAVNLMAGIKIHISFENEQMDADYQAGTFVKIKNKKN